MADLEVKLSEKDVLDLIKFELGFGEYIDFGKTGRRFRWKAFGREAEQDETIEFDLRDVLDRANILDNDTLVDAAKAGIERLLQEDGNRLKNIIRVTAETMAVEQREAPLEGEIT